MRVFRGLPNPASRTPCALTIGNFDGVHRGHRALIERVRTAADRLGIPACVMTFEPHPREFFYARMVAEGRVDDAVRPPARIANLRDKLDELAACGVDRVIVERFNARFASLSAEHFIEDIVVAGCHARWLMVGDDFRFGAHRRGGFAMLEDAGERFGFAVDTLASVTTPHDGEFAPGDETAPEERVSSSAIRAALAAGDLGRAERLLGHPYFISGHVIHGRKLGRTIGFPTANILPHGRTTDRQTALSGIFIVRVHDVAGEPVPGVASIGVRPTVEDAGRVVLEVHLFDFAGSLYGKRVRVEFIHKLRDEEKYDDVARLSAAIAADARAARAWFGLRQGAASGVPRTTDAVVAATDRIT
ncbi:MAG: bifunctional riboflavin kinase/FAD synthetase [Burkholderiaceae bacterium]